MAMLPGGYSAVCCYWRLRHMVYARLTRLMLFMPAQRATSQHTQTSRLNKNSTSEFIMLPPISGLRERCRYIYLLRQYTSHTALSTIYGYTRSSYEMFVTFATPAKMML